MRLAPQFLSWRLPLVSQWPGPQIISRWPPLQPGQLTQRELSGVFPSKLGIGIRRSPYYQILLFIFSSLNHSLRKAAKKLSNL